MKTATTALAETNFTQLTSYEIDYPLLYHSDENLFVEKDHPIHRANKERFGYHLEDGDVVKIMAKNHQYIGVNKVINKAENIEELKGKLGVFWHTHGSGKSYSMVFICQKTHRKFGGSYTLLIVVDRSKLGRQLYNTFTGVGATTSKEVVAKSRDHLRELLKENHRYVFSLIHKFSIDPRIETEYPLITDRKNIIVISDEAHHTQAGTFARNMGFQMPLILALPARQLSKMKQN